jgi:hypothetical protein
MRTECKTIYRIDELSDEAKEKALNKWCENHEYFSGDEIVGTLKAGAELFGFKLKDYCVDYTNSNGSYIREQFNYDYEDEIFELTGKRLYSYLVGMTSDFLKPLVYSLHANGKKKSCHFSYKYDECTKKRFSKVIKVNTIDDCPLTGCCYDYYFLKPLIDFLKEPNNSTTFKDIFDDCVHELFVGAEKDYESELTIEYFEAHAEANEYEFYEDGTWY